MKKIVFHALPLAFCLSFVMLVVTGKTSVTAQVSVVSRTAKTTPAARALPEKRERSVSRFTSAAAENDRLRRSLNWTFGSRAQTGWDVYVPLISDTIGVTSMADSAEFAEAVAKWQSGKGLTANGVIDETTLSALRATWQAARFPASVPADQSLLLAPASDFYDPSRSPDLRQLGSETYAAYKRMVAAAEKEISRELSSNAKYLKIVSAYRSPAYQAELRRLSPGSGREALAVNSPHSSGRAIDIYVGGEPVSTRDANRLIQINTPGYKWLVKNAQRFGFYPYFYEPWHWEYVGTR